MKSKKIVFFLVLVSFLVFPLLSHAQISNAQLGVGKDTTVTAPSAGGSGFQVGTQVNFVPNSPKSGNTGVLLCTLAENGAHGPLLGDLFNYITCIISKSVIPLIIGLAVVLFIWGVVQYVINTEDEAKKKKGKQFMIWGIIALTVMVSVWGLVSILGRTLGINNVVPQLQTQSS
ncbi:MAG: hypothetical protein ABH951_02425 [Patescibacteria group bacterium]